MTAFDATMNSMDAANFEEIIGVIIIGTLCLAPLIIIGVRIL